MRTFFLLGISLFFSLQALAQKQYDLVGFLFLEEARPINYRLILEEEKGVINGYSITGTGTDYETKSEVSGRLLDGELTLNEFQILSTISEEPVANFCFISLEALQKGSKKKQLFEGTFSGRLVDSTECASGKVVFADKAKLEKKVQQVQKIQEVIGEKKEKNKLVTLGNDETYTTYWSADKLKIHLWDSSQEDGDRVTLIINGEQILSNELMRSKKRKISYPLQKGTNIIELIAENEGAAPNNTTRLELVDENMKHAVLSELSVGEKLQFKIIH